MTVCFMLRLCPSAVLIAAILAAWAAGAEAPLPTQFELKLINAVFRGSDPAANHASLVLNLRQVGDRWERVVGTAGNLSRGIDVGHVTGSKITDDAVEFSLGMHIVGDGYTEIDEWAHYDVKAAKKEDGRFYGTWKGDFKGAKREGAALVTKLPPLDPPPAGFTSIEPGEHPRLLFRASDLPGLRKKAETPFGKAALAKMNDAIGLGVKYQLTGDKKYANQAQAFVERLMEGEYELARAPGSHHGMLHWAAVWEQPAVAYDLCYDAWPDDFKRKVERFITMWTNRILYQHSMFNTQAQYDFGNSEAMWFHFGPALGCLALWGEPGEKPARPIGFDDVAEVPPAEDYEPGNGVPVVPLKLGASPEKWLATPPLNIMAQGDPLEQIGGVAAARPEAGTSFSFDYGYHKFEPLDKKQVPPGGGVILNIGTSLSHRHIKRPPGPEIKKDGPLTMCLYTVLKSEKEQWVKVSAPFTMQGSQQFTLNGCTLAHGQVVKIGKGLYPLMVTLRIRARWNHLTPHLAAATDADREAWEQNAKQLEANYENERKAWEWDVAAWERTGFNQQYQTLFEITRWAMYTHQREGFGTGGAQSDTSGMCRSLALLPANCAVAYRNSFGVDLSPYDDITHFVPRKIFAHIYPKDGEPVTLSVNGPNEIDNQYFALHYPLVPDAWKPAVLWAWRRHVGLEGANTTPAKLLAGSVDSVYSRAFVNYPLDGKSAPPQGILPLAWEAPTFGYYGFRNGYLGNHSILVQIYGRFHSGQGYSVPNAGNFVIGGLGHTWARSMPSLRLHNQRAFANVVLLPNDETNEGARGRLLYARTEKDGSGAVTFDLSHVYAAAQADRKGKPQKLYEKYGNIPIESAFQDSGITGLRAYGVDYSGKSGAECLFVLVDKITGGEQKLWMWRLKDKVMDKRGDVVLEEGDLDLAKVDGNTVTLTHEDGATMRLTFVSPGKLDVKAEKRNIVYTKTYNRGKGVMSAPGIYAQTNDKNAEFFVIVTIGRGQPPAVKAQGSGLSATVSVGKQTVRFDGERVVIGK